MANQQIGFQDCKDAMQAQIMANAMEQAGGDVFSITESGGRWNVWFKFVDNSVPSRITMLFRKGWLEFEENQKLKKNS